MRLGLASTAYADLALPAALDAVRALGLRTIELPVDVGARTVTLDDLLDADARAGVVRVLAEAGVEVVALANHLDGQLVLGPHHATGGVFRGTPEEKRAWAVRRMTDTARAADALGVRMVTGFSGCTDYARWFRWPGQPGWEANLEDLAARWGPVLDVYERYGVRFSHELHPKQAVFDLDTALASLELFADRSSWGFTLDTANLALAGGDPVSFVDRLGGRVWHVHAKDAEHVRPVAHEHVLCHPRYGQLDANFRFRVPGWGELDWARIVTALHLAGYGGVVAVEHEDPTIGRWEGCRRGLAHVGGLLPQSPREDRWW